MLRRISSSRFTSGKINNINKQINVKKNITNIYFQIKLLSVQIRQIKTFAMLKEGFEDIKGVIRICKSEGQTTQWPKDKGS